MPPTYRLATTDRYEIDRTVCRAVYLFEHHEKGDIEAVVTPELGMALAGFSLRHVPILQKSRRGDFVRGRKGLGPVILPHFNQRAAFPELTPAMREAFPHLAYLAERRIRDPFQHGVGRYVAWEYETKVTDAMAQVRGFITGRSLFQGIPLNEITGFDFTAAITYTLADRSLAVRFDLTGTAPVTAGIHYYYALPPGASHVAMTVENLGLGDDDSLFEFSSHQRDGKFYRLPLDRPVDTLFAPVAEEKGMARFSLVTPAYRLDTRVLVEGPPETAFGSVVVFHPEGTDFVCVEPLSEKNPLEPKKKAFHSAISLHPIIP